VIFGDVANEGVAALKDIGQREFLVLSILAIAVLILGLWPAPLLNVMGPTLDQLIEHISHSKLP
jgi:NADH-quinone oxidoreductase subunit M